MDGYKQALKQSKRAFVKHVAPLIRRQWKVKYIHPCEGKDSGLDGTLDRKHGIDYQLFKDGVSRGLASRILFKRNFAHVFTLRHSRDDGRKAEYAKLKANIEAKDVFPEIFLQACVVDGKLLTCAAVATVDLLKYIEEHNPPLRENKHDDGQHQFFWAISWHELKQAGVKLFILANTEQAPF